MFYTQSSGEDPLVGWLGEPWPRTGLIWFKEQNTTGSRHADESFAPEAPASVPVLPPGAEREQLQRRTTYPFVDVHLQGGVVQRKQLGMRTSCLVADGELEEPAEARVGRRKGGRAGGRARKLTTSPLVRP